MWCGGGREPRKRERMREIVIEEKFEMSERERNWR
jgi:hypothetical protein